METTLTSKGQVVIPVAVRNRLGIAAGTSLHVEVNDASGEIILKPITRKLIHQMSGRFKGKGLLEELAAERNKEKMRDDRR
ncbi:MAG: AbrB/MazE/SpoVT family DNA-binding domain-containing protein [Acidobacteria bacterium]|nr:AbrB/MazE/SpoVT family DNA-binding domain-containing protein [Spirochaetota bacterium]MBS1769002.1 AbrB/MazE/SpoVT family DNA-binding domain-containing protein [Acidobacteriota bacterium]